ncbi:MAG: hypothetical protein HGA31_00325 [Candidatus Moranbacteria bacterium]|nr:hypothetical protein [Candidatus Moranbacteria bacterium]
MANSGASLETAQRLFDDRYFSPSAAKDVFDITFELPRIPFSLDTLELHASQHGLLVYYHDRIGERPLRLAEMASGALSGGRNTSDPGGPFFLNKGQFDPDGVILDDPYKLPNDPLVFSGTPRSGWQLVSSDILPQSRNKHMIELIDSLVEYVEAELFDGAIPPDSVFGEALLDWNPERETGRCGSSCGRKNGSERMAACNLLYGEGRVADATGLLASCRITNLLFEPFPNAVYRFLLSKETGDGMFRDGVSRTLTPTSRGKFVTFGMTSTFGGFLEEEGPNVGWSSLGVVFSRMGY